MTQRTHQSLLWTAALSAAMWQVVPGCTPKPAPRTAPLPPRAPVVQPAQRQSRAAPTQPAPPSPAPAASRPAAGAPATQAASEPATFPQVQPTTAPAAEAAEAPAEPEVVTEPNTAFAERLADVAQDLLRDQHVVDASWNASRAMLQAARRLAPDEARFAELIIEADLHTGDVDAAIQALSDYRRLVPDDQAAQVQQMDLYLERMETADARLNYLQRLVDAESLPQPVRSAAAVRLAHVYEGRTQSVEAEQAIQRALALNPLNLDALRMQYARAADTALNAPAATSPATAGPATGGPATAGAAKTAPTTAPGEAQTRQLSMLLAMLRSNPSQPLVMTDVAQMLAEAGLVAPATQTYQVAFSLYNGMALAPTQDFIVDFACEFFLGDDTKSAEQLARQLVSVDEQALNAWFLRLLIARADGDAARYEALRQQVGVVLANRLAEIARAAGDTSATTRPVPPEPSDASAAPAGPSDASTGPAAVDVLGPPPAGPATTAPSSRPGAIPPAAQPVALPDPAAGAALVKKSNQKELIDAYASAAMDVAWFRIFFEHRPDAAGGWIDVVRTLRKDPALVVTRLQGWSYLVGGNAGEARVKLSAVADRDPLSALGLIRLDADQPAERAGAIERATALLRENSAGPLGAVLYESLRPMGVKVIPDAAGLALQAEMDRFPRDLLQVLDQPQRFYALRADPVKVANAFGEPILLRVSIQNIGTFPLTIGVDGTIRPDLWFDAQLRGVTQGVFSGVAYDRISGPLVLQPGEGTSQIVKINQGALRSTLEANPAPSIQFMATVLTNPVAAPPTPDSAGSVQPGPAGYRSSMSRFIERSGTPIMRPDIRRQVLDTVSNGSPAAKVQALDLIATYVLMQNGQLAGAQGQDQANTPEMAEQMASMAREFRESIRRAGFDPDPNVSAWAGYLAGYIAAPAERPGIVARLASSDRWQHRLMAALLVQTTRTSPERLTQLAESDADAVVRRYATAITQVLSSTTQPAATQSTTGVPGAAAPPTTEPEQSPLVPLTPQQP